MQNKKKGLTLIELLISVSITAIMASLVVLMLKSSLDSFTFGQESATLEKALDDYFTEINGDQFEGAGIKDALEIIAVDEQSITFVPMWTDEKQTPQSEHYSLSQIQKIPFILDPPVKAGTFFPIAQVRSQDEFQNVPSSWESVPIIFELGERNAGEEPQDKIFLQNPLKPGQKIRFLYHPDVRFAPHTAMTIARQDKYIQRTYNNQTTLIPKNKIPAVTVDDFRLEYFDNTNTAVNPQKELIPNITAIKVHLSLALQQAKEKVLREATAFLNIRNTRTYGKGLLINPGMRIKIPDSKNIRVLSLADIIGVKDGDTIELEARPDKGVAWRIRMQMGVVKKVPFIRQYFVEYPPGNAVYSQIINLTTDNALNFLTLGGNGRYDYDFDPDTPNVVELEGDVELTVTHMDVTGAALFIRP